MLHLAHAALPRAVGVARCGGRCCEHADGNLRPFNRGTIMGNWKHWGAILVISLLLVSVASAHPQAPVATTGQSEPGAGAWPTWLLASGSELRLPPPPGEAETRAELAELQAVAAARDAAALDAVGYWDAGAPGYRWTE